VLGVALVVIGVRAQESPPAPPRALGTIPARGSPAPASTSPGRPGREQAGAAWIGAVQGNPGLPPPAPTAGAAPRTPALPWSLPVALAIPAIGVHTNVIDLGLGPDRTLQVPPLTRTGVREAGWYDFGPAPGQLGPAVIAGHVDSYQSAGVFFRLGALRPGDQINVTRADGTVAIFRVDAVDEYSKDSFPNQQVYGSVDYAALHVITCGGRFDDHTRHYLSNIVIYATLTGSQPRRNR
jgi:Sortase domain